MRASDDSVVKETRFLRVWFLGTAYIPKFISLRQTWRRSIRQNRHTSSPTQAYELECESVALMGMLWKELLPAAARPYGCCNPRLLEAVGCEGEEWAEFLGMTCTYHTEQYHVLIGEGGWDYHNHAVKLTQIHGPAFFQWDYEVLERVYGCGDRGEWCSAVRELGCK